MRGVPGLACVAVVAFAFALPGLSTAEEPPGRFANYPMESVMEAGYRVVDIDGSKGKYREDHDLRSGGRLLSFTLGGNSSAPDTTPVDRFRLEIDTPGDEPVSHFRLSAADRKRFDLRASFTQSRYEYRVPQLFEAGVSGNVRTDDLHDFDFDRTNGSVDLTIRSSRLPAIHLGYRLYRRSGDAISTVRIPEGDTFLIRAPVDAVTNVGLVGTTFRAFETDVTLRQEYRRVDREQTLRDRLNPTGLDPSDNSTLTSYRSDQDQHIDIPATTMRLRRLIGDAAEVSAGYFFSRAELGFDYRRNRSGTANTAGFGGTEAATGEGDATITTHVVDLATSVRVSERARIHGAYRLNDRSQDGSFEESSTFGPLDSETEDAVRVHRLSGELEWEPMANLLLRGGGRYSRREADLSLGGQSITTETAGAIGSIRYRPRSFVNLFARYENAQVENPFVVPGDRTNAPPLPSREISFSLTNRASAGIGLKPWEWIDLDYRFIADVRENDTSGARSRTFGNNIALTLRPVSGLTFLVSLTRRDLDGRTDAITAPLYQTSSWLQDGIEHVLVSVMQYDFPLLGQRWATGWNVTFVDSDSSLKPRLESDGRTQSSYDLDRIDGGAFLTLYHKLVEPTVEIRVIDYNQRPLTRNDYRATVVLLKATKRFSF